VVVASLSKLFPQAEVVEEVEEAEVAEVVEAEEESLLDHQEVAEAVVEEEAAEPLQAHPHSQEIWEAIHPKSFTGIMKKANCFCLTSSSIEE